MEICKKEQCTGCGACLNICPESAVSMQLDELGKTYAVVNTEKCINCGMCINVCPANNMPEVNQCINCYAIWSKNSEYSSKCASGGLSTGFAESVVKNDGVVYGVKFDEELNLVFDSTENHDFSVFMGSKYVQSDTRHIYSDVQKKLKDGRQVLFVGTPCQVGGLKNFLRKDYENLITVDLICHGTPPISYLKDHIKGVTDEKITDISFRGEKDFFLTLYNNEECVYSKRNHEDTYFTAFLEGLTYRDNCYTCKFARPERVADITIGDFWGLDKSTMTKKHNGRISLMIVNTQKGKVFFDTVKESFEFEERDINEALKHNGQLVAPSKMHEDRILFEEMYKKYGFEKAVNTPRIKKKIRNFKMKKTLIYRVFRKIKSIRGNI